MQQGARAGSGAGGQYRVPGSTRQPDWVPFQGVGRVVQVGLDEPQGLAGATTDGCFGMQEPHALVCCWPIVKAVVLLLV